MQGRSALSLALAVAALAACGPPGNAVWFDGDLRAAGQAAADRDTLVMVEFYTDWCSWCRRLENDTLSDREVRRELDELVAVKLNAETDGAAAAAGFKVESYPTIVFLDPGGDEVERIVGYLPPQKFLLEIRRIRNGDTLAECLDTLREDPANIEAITRAVEGLLERSDPEGAIAKIKTFQADDEPTREVRRHLMFLAGRDLHYRVYLRAAALYRDGWPRPVEVPQEVGVRRLHALVADGLTDLGPGEQAELMRGARYDDASELLALVNPDAVNPDDLFGVAEFAFRGGHYELAGGLYRRWFDETKPARDADALNRAAWQLYLAHESMDTAIEMARIAYATDPSADVADTLARLLYVSGKRAEAVSVAAAAAAAARWPETEQIRDLAKQMEAGVDLGDEPAFEHYPGPRETSL